MYEGVQCVEERDGSNNPDRQYLWGIYIDELLQQRNDISGTPVDLYPLQDTLYRTTALTNSSGTIIEVYDTDAYGNTLIFNAAGTGGNWWADDALTTDEPTCAFIFTGRRYDAESALYFYRFRYFLAQLGRFISRDPVDRLTVTLYEYVLARPNIFVDPKGTKFEPLVYWHGQLKQEATLWDHDRFSENDRVADFKWVSEWECDCKGGLKLLKHSSESKNIHSDVQTKINFLRPERIDKYTYRVVMTGEGFWDEWSITAGLGAGVTGAAVVGGAGAKAGGAAGSFAPGAGTAIGAGAGALIGGVLGGIGGAYTGRFHAVATIETEYWLKCSAEDARVRAHRVSANLVSSGDLAWTKAVASPWLSGRAPAKSEFYTRLSTWRAVRF